MCIVVYMEGKEGYVQYRTYQQAYAFDVTILRTAMRQTALQYHNSFSNSSLNTTSQLLSPEFSLQ